LSLVTQTAEIPTEVTVMTANPKDIDRQNNSNLAELTDNNAVDNLIELLSELAGNENSSHSPVNSSKSDLDPLIPLIAELLDSNADKATTSILKVVVPSIDNIIEQRSTADLPKMAAAIAKILPHAITEKIRLSPLAIAKALAPEIAIAIREQITLDEDAISDALGSEMGKAIKTQIELEKLSPNT
jgi:hypothetical protein